MQSEQHVRKGDMSMRSLGNEKTYVFRNVTMAQFPADNLQSCSENKTQTEV
jgi:hypothetical protein